MYKLVNGKMVNSKFISNNFLCSLTSDKINDIDTIDMFIPHEMTYYRIKTLLDTGAKTMNYIHPVVVKKLGLSIVSSPTVTCSALGSSKFCEQSVGFVVIKLIFFDENVNSFMPIEIKATVQEIAYDLIIGKPTLRETDLHNRVPAQFWEGKACSCHPCGGDVGECSVTDVLPCKTDHLHAHEVDTKVYTNLLTHQIIASLTEMSNTLDETINPPEEDVPESFGIDWDESRRIKTNPPSNIPTHIEGSEAFRAKQIALCEEFADIFSREARAVPADLPPLELNVDIEKWNIPKNRQPPRPQSLKAQEEIRKQVEAMLELNIIEESEAQAWSQVLMIPKPSGAYRFCQDVRSLNDLTVSESWPIPNIRDMITRIGDKKSRFFAVMDLTAGYHQAPLAEKSRILTAFICFMGLYQWLRVTMGLKRAPGWFQKMMTTVVLVGLIYVICEAYLDDIITFGKTEDEYLGNLRRIFERFRQYGIVLSPDKTHLGMSQAEYVGHLFTPLGHTFSRDRINSTLNMKKPKVAKELKTFLGLANYFHQHIRNLSHHTKVLETLIPNYTKNSTKVLNWSEETDASYAYIIEQIKECPTLYFLTEDGEVVLETDASDYGIGAYLYQIVDGVPRPIAFISKALNKTQLNWSPYEKEAYAIYFALRKLEYLLRDIQFRLKTDHKNLTFITTSGSPKVIRWKMEMQTYNFDMEYFAGELNTAADAFSRLCALESVPLEEEMEVELTPLESLMNNINNRTKITDDEPHIPGDLYKCISRVHNSRVGHFGVDLTYKRLIESSWFKQMNEERISNNEDPHSHVKRFVRLFKQRCPCCQKMDELKVPITTKAFTTASFKPMRRLNIDAIGPLPMSAEGYMHILVIIDTFTRFAELYAVRNVTAKSAAKAILNHSGRYGVPDQLLSDRGPQFVNGIIKEFLDILQIDQELTMAYSKEENAIVERSNKEVMRHLRAIIFDDKIIDEWEDSLPLVQRIINSKVHLTTGVSPAQLLFGNAIDLDDQILNSPSESNSTTTISDWADKMLTKQKQIITLAQKYQMEHDEHHLLTKVTEVKNNNVIEEFPINSFVLVEYPNRPPHKLALQNAGPFRVLKRVGAKYSLLNLATNKKRPAVHIKFLRPYMEDGITDPRLVANADYQMFDVEKVISHTGKTKSEMNFMVKWVGYADSYNSEVPWSQLRTNVKLHQYLISKNMKKMIPRSFIHLYP